MSGWKDWQIGEVVTEGEFQSFIQDQVVQVYANASARDSALGANEATGMVAYLTETDEYQVYNSVGEWVAVGAGTISSVIAGTALTGGGTEGDVTLNVDLSAITIPTSQISDITATASELNILDGATVTADALNTIDDGTSGFTALSNGTAGISYQPVSHNYIINGAFDIWQRGTSFTASGFTADRFLLDPRGSVTLTRQAFTAGELEVASFGGANFYLRTVSTGGSINQGRIEYRVEGVEALAGQTATLSFFAKMDAANVMNVTTFQSFGSGGSSAVQMSGTNVSVGTTWQRYSITINFPSISGKTIGPNSVILLRIMNTEDESYTFDIWGVQLEAGSVATPFKRHAPSLGLEEQACKRYFVNTQGETNHPDGFGYAVSTTSVRSFIPLTIQMRALPSFVGTVNIRHEGSSIFPNTVTVGVGGVDSSAGVTLTLDRDAATYTANQAAIINLAAGATFSAEL